MAEYQAANIYYMQLPLAGK